MFNYSCRWSYWDSKILGGNNINDGSYEDFVEYTGGIETRPVNVTS